MFILGMKHQHPASKSSLSLGELVSLMCDGGNPKESHNFRSVVIKLDMLQVSKGLVKAQMAGPQPRVSETAGLGWDLSLAISSQHHL